MPRKIAFLLATTACVFGWVAVASATTCSGSTCTVMNSDTAPTTIVQADTVDTNNADTSFFGSTSLGANVGGAPTSGGDFTTTGLTVSYASSGGNNGTVTLVFNTNFAQTGGTQQITNNPSTSVYAADIFIESASGLSGALTSTFNYGISLGYTATKDGGIDTPGAQAGLYQGKTAAGVSYLTSNNIWGAGSANGAALGSHWGDYGGEFGKTPTGGITTQTTCASTGVSCEASPTVLTAANSTQDTAIGVTDSFSSSGDSGFGTLTVALSGTTADLEAIFSDFDIFWGTADCSNAPIWGNIADLFPNTSVPEPSSLALLASAAIGLGVLRRRKRKGWTAA